MILIGAKIIINIRIIMGGFLGGNEYLVCWAIIRWTF